MSSNKTTTTTTNTNSPTITTLGEHDKLLLNKTFNQFKPICDELITILSNTDKDKYKNQDNKQIIINLEYLIQSLIDITTSTSTSTTWTLNYIFDYVMIPISLIFNSFINSSSSTSTLSINNEKVLFCIKKESIQLKSLALFSNLLERIKIKQFKKFINIQTLIINYLNIIIQQTQGQAQTQQNDEFYKILLLNIRLLFNSCEDSFFNDKELYSKHPFSIGDQFVPFGYTISTLLNLLTTQPHQVPQGQVQPQVVVSREIKKELITTLDYIIEPFLKRNLEYYNILFQIFPGIVSSLFKIISGDYKLGSIIKVQCLELFSKLISNTMNDKVKEQVTAKTAGSNSNIEQINSMFKESESNLFNMFCLIYPTSNSYSALRPQHSLYNKVTASSSSSSTSTSTSTTGTSNSSSNVILTSNISLERYQNKEALIKSAFLILSNCKNSLKSLSPILVEVLVLFYSDDYPQIKEQTLNYFRELKEQDTSILDILQENFNHLFQSLSLLICNGGGIDNYGNTQIDEEKKSIILKLVVSYLMIIFENNNSDQSSSSSIFSTRIDMVANTLISIVEMQSPTPPSSSYYNNEPSKSLQKSLEDSLKIVSDNPFEKKQKKSIMSFTNLSLPFINFYSKESEKQIIKIIELIGKFSDIRDWIDVLISNSLLSNSPKRKEILFCLNHLLIGTTTTTSIDFSTIQYILDEIMSPNLLNLVISKDQDLMYSNSKSTTTSLLSISNNENDYKFELYFDNTITVSLVIESIGILTRIVGKFELKRYRQIFLGKVIYQLLEKFGLSSLSSGGGNGGGLIEKQCINTLNEIMNSFNFESIQDIIFKNSDYLLDTIESHMKYLESFPNTPSIFEGILNITGLGFLPFLTDTIRMILSSLDIAIENSKNIQIFISILYNIIKVLYNNSKNQLLYQQILNKLKEQQKQQSVNQQPQVIEEDEVDDKKQETIEDIKQFFMSHHLNKDKDEQHRELYKQQQTTTTTKTKTTASTTTEMNDIENITPESLNIPNFIETTEIQRQMVQEIIQKSIHFIGSKNKIIKMTTIDIIEMGLIIVATGTRKYGGVDDDEDENENEKNQILNEDDETNKQKQNQNQQQEKTTKTNSDKGIQKVALFPLIHLVWGSLVKRVSESDRIVAKKSLEVIQTISNLSSEFISQRFWEQLWPIIYKILIDEQLNQIKSTSTPSFTSSSSKTTNTATTTATTNKKVVPLIIEIDETLNTFEKDMEIKMKKEKLKYTPSFKVQFVCLQTLKTILLGTVGKMNQNQVLDIANATIYYLNKNQPEQFQSISIDIWKDVLLKNDSDSLWLLLFNLSNEFNNEIYHHHQQQQDNSSSIIISQIPTKFQYSQKDIIDYKSNATLLFNLIN